EHIRYTHAATPWGGCGVLGFQTARAAAAFPDADIEIVETHHHRKLDVPSGTALLLARVIQKVRGTATLHIGRHENGRRTPQEIGVHSIRLGNTVGVHEILISTGSETLSLKHQAEDRTLFAEGALTAAAFLQGRDAGYYTMQDLLGN
ncbi:MAG: 4-hydroxy-tetrahydrodipicolinate reductase, partial [Oscillospiraceae bacterium]|nr:4-hydroxy-tetrahydrodipicolinate reductase [Oscillospiraceae bacterium]